MAKTPHDPASTVAKEFQLRLTRQLAADLRAGRKLHRPRMPRLAPATPQAEPVQKVATVHPGVWRTAMQHANGDASRIEVLSYTHVQVAL